MINKYSRIAITFLICFISLQVGAQTPKKYFSGIYTVGGNNANYQTIQRALIDILAANSEVIGRVTFNIRPGVYDEVLTLKPFKGASAKNFILFKSETGKASDVVIKAKGDNTLYNNQVIRFEGCSYYTLQDLTIENSSIITASNQFASVIHFTYHRDTKKPAEYNTVNRCIIKVDSTFTVFNGNTIPIIASDINNTSLGENCANYNTISNNTIYGGAFGIRMIGKNAQLPSKGNKITGNKFYKCYSGMDFDYHNVPLISFNQIYCRENPIQSQLGIRVRNATGNFSFHGNTIKDYGTFGFFFSNIIAGSAAYVYNNIIVGKAKPEFSRGIHIEYSRSIQFLHNSIYYDAPKSKENTCIAIENVLVGTTNSTTRISLKNNIFYARGGGHPIIIRSTASIDTSNYNVYYNELIDSLGLVGITNRFGIDGLRAATGKDGQSQRTNPLFASPTSLRINSKNLIRKAAIISFITVDFENQPRDPETPDIGADEVIRSAVDLEVFHLEKNYVPKQGSNLLPVVIKNDGLLSLNGNKILVSYSVNNGPYTTPQEFTLQTLSKPYSKQTVNLSTPWVIPGPGLYTLILRVTPPVPGDTWQVNDADTLSICVGLEGEYTIGGPAGPKNYPTFDAAIAAFGCGVGGPTVFNVYPGTYPPFSLPNLKGVSSTNTLTFRSVTGNAADVIVQNTVANQTNNNHHAIQMDNVGFVRIRNFTINNTSTSLFGSGVHIAEGSTNIIIDSCIITVPSTNNGSAFLFPVVMSQKVKIDSGAVYSDIMIKNSVLKNGVTGIQMYGRNTNIRAQNNGAINNSIDSSYLYGINANFVNVGEISKNNITFKQSASTNSEAIRITVSKYNTVISNNKTLHAGFRALNLTSVEGVTGVTIANNMFGGGFRTTGNGAGIYFNEVNKINLYHNSVYYDASSVEIPNNASAFFLGAGSNVSLFNNIFYNPAGGYAFYVSTTTSIRESNNNIYYTDADQSQGLYAYWNSSDRVNLSALRAAMLAFETKSLEINPNFVSNYDLHTTNPALDGKGVFISSVLYDFDNEDRNPFGADIGADEFIIHQKDLALMDITPLVFSTDPNLISIKLVNLGSTSLNSSTIKLQYTADGTTWLPANGESYTIGAGGNASLAKSYSSANFTFSTPFTGTLNSTYPFAVRVMPSDRIVGDIVTSNDTVGVLICTGLKGGTYTIGGSNPNYTDFASAMNAITCGITGPVVFNVRAGTYNERFTIGNPRNTSAVNTITIKAENNDSSSVIINSTGVSSNTTRNTIRLNRSKYVNLKYLTIQNLSNSIVGSAAIQITSESSNINVSNCRILMDPNTTSPNIFGITTSDSASLALGGRGGSNIKISRNYISGGNLAIAFKGANVYARDAGIIIDSNIIINPAFIGISTSNTDVLSINANKVSMRENQLSSTGLSMTVNREDTKITNNAFHSAATNGATFDDVLPVNGILFANNMVGANFRAGADGVALNLNKVFPMKIYNNSIYYDGNTSLGAALKIDNDSRGIRLLNNSIANEGQGFCFIFTNFSSIDTSEHNNYYTKGTLFAKVAGTDYTSFDDFREITLTDIKSVSVDPDYFSKTNLHLTNVFLDAGAFVLKEITRDFDGELRNPDFPDIGADEFNIIGDAEIISIDSPLPSPDVYPDKIRVIITVRNKGESKVSGLNVKYFVDNVEMANEVIPVEDPYKPLLPSDLLTYEFETLYEPTETGVYTLRAEAYLPEDVDLTNNVAEVVFKSSISSIVDGEVNAFVSPANSSVNGKTPVVVMIRNAGTIAIKEFNVNFRIRGGTSTGDVSTEFFGADSIMPQQTAAFTFSDSIDCDDRYDRFIDVFISDLNADVTQINDTLSMYIKPFAGCFQSVAIDTKELMLTNPWPNPTASELNYDLNLYQETDMTIELVNVLGNIVKTINYNQLSEGVNHLNIDVQDLAPGVYYSRVTVFGKAYTNRVVITR